MKKTKCLVFLIFIYKTKIEKWIGCGFFLFFFISDSVRKWKIKESDKVQFLAFHSVCSFAFAPSCVN